MVSGGDLRSEYICNKPISVVSLLWQWWLERNRVREGERTRLADDLAFISSQNAHEYLSISAQEVGRDENGRNWYHNTENADGQYVIFLYL